MDWVSAFGAGLIATRAELVSVVGRRRLDEAIRSGTVLRVRRDHYAPAGTDTRIIRAVRVGGQLGCVSALKDFGVFALERELHVHLAPNVSRARHPDDRARRLSARRAGVRVHWSPLLGAGSREAVSLGDALAQAARCQPPWLALASIENALFLRKIGVSDLPDIFAGAPGPMRRLRELVDGRAEAGQETVLRMIMVEAGLTCEVQVTMPGIGRVDLVVEGRIVLEADSRLAHDGWEMHVKDRDRDLALARLGYATLRPVYQRTMNDPTGVLAAVRGLLAAMVEH